MKRIIYFLILALFFNCKIDKKEKNEFRQLIKNSPNLEFIDNLKKINKINVREMTLEKSEIISNEIKSITSNDSVQILEYKKIGEGKYKEENCTIIDYRNNTSLKSIMSSYTLFYLKNEINNGKYVYENEINNKTENTNKSLESTYFRVESYKNNLVVNSNYVYFPIYLNNNSIAFTYMDGIQVSYFSEIEKTKNETFIYHLNDKQFYEIKIIDKSSMIQIWKDQDNNYSLLAPLKTSLKLPILQTIYTELDYSFEEFDEINLEQIFNSENK
ncbi:hypothetical protein QSV08_07640 [Maribacter sp. BPC-D8]|uniref:hypothetical protein n=1 Tax=Maribacter sp. BPC-D8 TaxID=3053613 RepID=UPI002B47152B|nr:hypothetical protein [Maribacter sp. BPC-D8]WRI31116.1 hypothetical protein QSV08_07640 [Maribacter sp. BPC-D8]